MGAAFRTSLQALVYVQVVFLLTLPHTPVIHAAKLHLVGDSDGWTLPPGSSGNVNYTAWVQNLTFHVGDSIVFVYQSSLHDVLQVSKDDYDNCNSDTPLSSFLDGETSITLNKAGVWYFICGIPEHCSGGQKLALTCMDSSPYKHLPDTSASSRPPFAPPPPPTPPASAPDVPSTPSPYANPSPPPPPSTPFLAPPTPTFNPSPLNPPSEPISFTPPNAPTSPTPPSTPISFAPPNAPDAPSIPSTPCEHAPPSPPLNISTPPPPKFPSPSKPHSQAPHSITNLFLLRILVLTPWVALLLII